MQTRNLVAVAATALVCGFAGALLALWTWSHFTSWKAERVEVAESAKAVEQGELPEVRQREAVKRQLNDPASATFRNEHISKADQSYWCGEVNAKNRMGGMVGYTRYVVEILKIPESSDLDEVHLDQGSENTVRFLAYWNGYCER